MRNALPVALTALALLALSAGQADAAPGQPPLLLAQAGQLDEKLPGIGDHDREFASSARATLLPTIEMSRLGAEKASDPEVVRFSERTAEAYAQLADELAAALGDAGIEQETGEAPHIGNRLDRLEDASSAFDLTYITEQRGAHKKLISIYTMEARAGRDERLRSHAEKGRQLFSESAAEIERIEGRLGEARTSPTR